jgi:ATP-dependent Clp protease ATP-binding subunit ClpX
MFEGLEKIIGRRVGRRTMGFESDISSKGDFDTNRIMPLVEPEDLITFGFIPEFVGRLPIITTLDDLSTEALFRILTEPKNALIKQYKKLLALENIRLEFTPEALHAVAQIAHEKKTGTRGLKAIMEEVMLEIMYEIPSHSNIRECLIIEECIKHGTRPLLRYEKKAVCA